MPPESKPGRSLLKRRLLWISFALAVVVAVVVLFTLADGPVGRASYDKIQVGMSREEVVAIIGLPPGNHATDFYTAVSAERIGHSVGGESLSWISNTGMIEVGLDDQKKVCSNAYWRLEAQHSLRAKLRSWWSSIAKL
jgi:hypothetical protein